MARRDINSPSLKRRGQGWLIVLRVSVQSNLQFDCCNISISKCDYSVFLGLKILILNAVEPTVAGRRVKQLQIRPNYLSVQTHWAVRCYLCAQAVALHLRLQVSACQEKCEFYCSEIRAKSINADFFPKKRVFEAFC